MPIDPHRAVVPNLLPGFNLGRCGISPENGIGPSILTGYEENRLEPQEAASSKSAETLRALVSDTQLALYGYFKHSCLFKHHRSCLLFTLSVR